MADCILVPEMITLTPFVDRKGCPVASFLYNEESFTFEIPYNPKVTAGKYFTYVNLGQGCTKTADTLKMVGNRVRLMLERMDDDVSTTLNFVKALESGMLIKFFVRTSSEIPSKIRITLRLVRLPQFGLKLVAHGILI